MQLSFRDSFKPVIKLLFISVVLGVPWVASAALIDGAEAVWGTAEVADGNSGQFFAPGHASPNESHVGHYFPGTGDDHHFAWSNVTPSSPGIITIKYDFRSQNGYTNQITNNQKTAAMAAFDAWSNGTNGKILFALDTAAARNNIVNIGTGDLAAVGYNSGSGGVLGVGGGSYLHYNLQGLHDIGDTAAWQDESEVWDTAVGNGDPIGTFDYFTVVAQEIGHTLGLGHTSGSGNIMNGAYAGELTALSLIDIEHIQSVYGNYSTLPSVPLPAAVWLLGSGLLLLFGIGRRQQFRRRVIVAA